MTRSVIIHVTEEDIKGGTPRESCECPVALALNRRFPDFQASVRAGYQIPMARRVDDINKTLNNYLDLPPYSQDLIGDFVTQFDRGEGGMPFEFEVILKEKDAEEMI